MKKFDNIIVLTSLIDNDLEWFKYNKDFYRILTIREHYNDDDGYIDELRNVNNDNEVIDALFKDATLNTLARRCVCTGDEFSEIYDDISKYKYSTINIVIYSKAPKQVNLIKVEEIEETFL